MPKAPEEFFFPKKFPQQMSVQNDQCGVGYYFESYMLAPPPPYPLLDLAACTVPVTQALKGNGGGAPTASPVRTVFLAPLCKAVPPLPFCKGASRSVRCSTDLTMADWDGLFLVPNAPLTRSCKSACPILPCPRPTAIVRSSPSQRGLDGQPNPGLL